MRFCKALFLASLPKIIANPLVPDRTANLADNPDLTANPADDLALTANPADNPDLLPTLRVLDYQAQERISWTRSTRSIKMA